MTKPRKQPPGSKPRPIPSARPTGEPWTAEELDTLHSWQEHLTRIDGRAFGAIRYQARTSGLDRQGWTEVMPGLWTRGLYPVLDTKSAKRRQREEDLAYRDAERAEAADHSRKWHRLYTEYRERAIANRPNKPNENSKPR